ncbi:unnamed protein product [Caretta caretta]
MAPFILARLLLPWFPFTGGVGGAAVSSTDNKWIPQLSPCRRTDPESTGPKRLQQNSGITDPPWDRGPGLGATGLLGAPSGGWACLLPCPSPIAPRCPPCPSSILDSGPSPPTPALAASGSGCWRGSHSPDRGTPPRETARGWSRDPALPSLTKSALLAAPSLTAPLVLPGHPHTHRGQRRGVRGASCPPGTGWPLRGRMGGR